MARRRTFTLLICLALISAALWARSQDVTITGMADASGPHEPSTKTVDDNLSSILKAISSTIPVGENVTGAIYFCTIYFERAQEAAKAKDPPWDVVLRDNTFCIEPPKPPQSDTGR